MPVGKPDAGDQHVRFDERGRETEQAPRSIATAPVLDSTNFGRGRRRLVWSRAFLRRFFQSYAWASAILVDELDAGGFECAADGEVIGGRKRNRILCNLSAADRIYAKG
jgi:hypothetical protein